MVGAHSAHIKGIPALNQMSEMLKGYSPCIEKALNKAREVMYSKYKPHRESQPRPDITVY